MITGIIRDARTGGAEPARRVVRVRARYYSLARGSFVKSRVYLACSCTRRPL